MTVFLFESLGYYFPPFHCYDKIFWLYCLAEVMVDGQAEADKRHGMSRALDGQKLYSNMDIVNRPDNSLIFMSRD